MPPRISTNIRPQAKQMSAMQRKAAPKYSDDERTVVRLLFEKYPNSSDAERRAFIFNYVFAEEHNDVGLPDGRDADSLKSCWSSRNRPGRQAAWDNILNGPLKGAEEQWKDLRKRIESADAALGEQDTDEVRQAIDPESARIGDTLCDGCDRNVSQDLVDSYQCIQCAQSDYCVDCWKNPEVEKCHARHQYARHRPDSRAEFDARSAQPVQDDYESMLDGGLLTAPQGSHVPPAVAVPRNPFDITSSIATPLDMIHKSQITWASDTALWIPGEDGQPIQHDSTVYKAGGKVHRVSINARSDHVEALKTEDYMVCFGCTDCGTDDTFFRPENEGTPFVHTADTLMRGGVLQFAPISNPKFDRQDSRFTDAMLHNVMYGDGRQRITAVCIVQRCHCYNDALLRGNWEEQRVMEQEMQGALSK